MNAGWRRFGRSLGWWGVFGGSRWWIEGVSVGGAVLVAVCLAFFAALGDSITFDETSHLTAGASYWLDGRFRLSPDHPPLGRLWAALPLTVVSHVWVPPPADHWELGQVFDVGRGWLFASNVGTPLLVVGRCMMIVLLAATVVGTYALAWRVFGGGAGRVALVLAALSPTLLAHGHYVTTDVPLALGLLVVLLAFDGLYRRLTLVRVGLAALALAALSVTKFSWPLFVPALVGMGLLRVFGREPWSCSRWMAGGQRSEVGGQAPALRSRSQRGTALLVLSGGFVFTTWLGIWTAYGWRYAMLPTTTEGHTSADPQGVLLETWNQTLREIDEAGSPTAAGMIAFARERRLLPEAYLFGLTYTLDASRQRYTYFLGEISTGGHWAYFPVAFLIKTPVATLLLLVCGLAALAWRGIPVCAPHLLLAIGVALVVYFAAAMQANLNIGHRHLVPLYPLLFVLCGAAAGFWANRWGRLGVMLLLAWLAIANGRIFPHYLAYFNEAVVGPAQGHRYLADSNIDWGQDLKRLAGYARGQETVVKLAYFGSGDPHAYGFACAALPSFRGFEPPATLGAGTYAISVNQLLGLYDPLIRESFWTGENRARYAALHRVVSAGPVGDASGEFGRRFEQAREEYAVIAPRWLLYRLRERAPTGRVGYSLWVYELSDADVAALLAP